MALTTVPLPYGLRDVKITNYTDAAATTLGTASDLPNSRTMSFAEAEDFEELRGDDGVVTTRGKGSTVDWELEAGGVQLSVVAIMYGGTVTSTGTTPNQKNVWVKKDTDARPFFKAEGQAISDSGGDVHIVLHRCRATGDLTGSMGDGAFWLTGCSGVALRSNVVADSQALYTITQNETATAIGS